MNRKGKANQDVETARSIERALKPQDNTITLSSGVVLRAKLFPPLILVQVMAATPRPDPPLVFIEQFGREMENPNDPDYIERLQAWKMDYSDRVVTAMVTLGTELVSAPRGLGSPDKDDWLDEYKLLRMPMFPESRHWRYMTWVKFRAVRDEHDMAKIQDVVGSLNGVREKTVQAAENFSGSDKTDR